MSGTSLDGLDIAACKFKQDKGEWSFEIIEAVTREYSDELKRTLFSAHQLKAVDLAKHHVELGQLHGLLTKEFIGTSKVDFDFVASHGHTIFHQPGSSLTVQIGSAPHIAAAVLLPVVADFRTIDVAFGGQGAPLVPIGDLYLFSEYDMCLNLGGVANISMKEKSSVHAFDICICNMALNYLAKKKGREYDAAGSIAASGNLSSQLLEKLNDLSFFREKKPKSIGKEFFEREILSLLDNQESTVEDMMHTFVEHIAMQISSVVIKGKRLLVTGGGTYNSFLIDRLIDLCEAEIVIPDDKIIQFKEALIFAFLGVLRIRQEINCLSSVTGASRDSIGGVIYLP